MCLLSAIREPSMPSDVFMRPDLSLRRQGGDIELHKKEEGVARPLSCQFFALTFSWPDEIEPEAPVTHGENPDMQGNGDKKSKPVKPVQKRIRHNKLFLL